jgi:hypothetical protein
LVDGAAPALGFAEGAADEPSSPETGASPDELSSELWSSEA